jgi:hypothetical protein
VAVSRDPISPVPVSPLPAPLVPPLPASRALLPHATDGGRSCVARAAGSE